jgi:hypothetical protein
MDTIAIVLEIDAEISRLQQVRQLLSAVKATEKLKPSRLADTALRVNTTKATRTLSATSRENIAAAQKKRWAKVRRAKKVALNSLAAPAAKKPASTSSAFKSVPATKRVFMKKTAQAKPKAPVSAAPLPTES